MAERQQRVREMLSILGMLMLLGGTGPSVKVKKGYVWMNFAKCICSLWTVRSTINMALYFDSERSPHQRNANPLLLVPQ